MKVSELYKLMQQALADFELHHCITAVIPSYGCSAAESESCLQSLLRGLLPDSFPARVAAEPGTEKQRRFIIIDENVYATYGEQLEQVCILTQLCKSFPPDPSAYHAPAQCVPESMTLMNIIVHLHIMFA